MLRRLFPSLFDRPPSLEPRHQPSIAGLESTLLRLKSIVEQNNSVDPELLALTRILCNTGDALAKLAFKVEQCLLQPQLDAETRAQLLAAMQDIVTLHQPVQPSAAGESPHVQSKSA
jgi:hypothetical protein